MATTCIYCDRPMLLGSKRSVAYCPNVDEHLTGEVYYLGERDVRPVQVIVRFFVDPTFVDPRQFISEVLGLAQAGHEPIPDFEVLPQVWKYTGKETTRNIGGPARALPAP
jgi:hypothetical protein